MTEFTRFLKTTLVAGLIGFFPSEVVCFIPAISSSNVPTFLNQADTSNVMEAKETENPRSEGLALLLDEGTRKSHSVAENSAFVTGFFKGMSNLDSFGSLVTSLYYVYEAMEEAFENTSDARVCTLDKPELRRMDSLKADMDYFYSDRNQKIQSPSPATKAYVDRIKEVAKSEPYLLIAHQYSRYLGDLFGGQMMGGMATRTLNLEQGKGISFYSFEGIPDAKIFIKDWYRSLNDLDLTDDQKNALVDEANLVFSLNIGIFEELEGSAVKSLFKIILSSIKSQVERFQR